VSSSIAVERLLDRIVGADAEVRVPPTAENIASTLATIAKSTGALIGFEVAMGDEPSFGGDRFAWSPCGLTLAQALDQVVAMDARYEWRERDGVIHVRPQSAFEDAGNFLNARVERFEIKNVLPAAREFRGASPLQTGLRDPAPDLFERARTRDVPRSAGTCHE